MDLIDENLHNFEFNVDMIWDLEAIKIFLSSQINSPILNFGLIAHDNLTSWVWFPNANNNTIIYVVNSYLNIRGI